ncbi:MAG: polyprenyl synthetase family protein [Clostridia bacterium]|nr:polyprenyl synthetase family protein [Clostridia bacterium]
MDFNAEFKRYYDIAQDIVEQYKLSGDTEYKKLMDAVNYSYGANGKRIRPVMLLAACEMAGGNIKDAMPFAAAIEMIHASSLIFDDLPAMDNDDLRRGVPTNHKVFGEATAILAGCVLMVRPFEIMSKAAKNQNQIDAISIMAEASGVHGMMGGQQIDLSYEGKKASKEVISELNRLKTGALFKASVVCGAVIAGADKKQLEAVSEYGDYLGLAFQLIDDLMDNNPDIDTGKTKGSDIENEKSTYLSIYGSEKCKELASEYTQKAVDALEIFGEKSEFLKQLVKSLESRIR